MSFNMKYNKNEDFIQLTVTGCFGLNELKNYAAKVAEFCTEKDCWKILNDMSMADIEFDFMDICNNPRYIDEAGIPASTQRALVVPEDFLHGNILEESTRNACHNLRVFKTLKKAKAWLVG